MASFEIGDRDFLLDGQPYQVISGALHYFRVHPDQWGDRILKARLMGLNTIETYVAWNFHSPERGRFETDGPRDLGRFLDLVAAEGMHAIVRPGPYICAEWDNGGLPAWLGTLPGMRVRQNEPQFMAAISEYFAALLPIVASRQVSDGGPVIAVQVENEYGAYGDDAEYLRALAALTRAGGITVPLLTCDQANDEMLARGGLPELHRTATFGSRALDRLAVLRRHQPTGPLMCMEFWNGWFDSWGQAHHVAPVHVNAQDLDDLLAGGASVNLYMFHGGTNFGLTSGANDKGTYFPITTSYDYDAPLSERGAPTAKYAAMRDVISRHAPVPKEYPASSKPAPAFSVALNSCVPLEDLRELLSGSTKDWDHLPTADETGQWSGLTLYEATVATDDAVLAFEEVRDRAQVFLNGDPVGTLDRARHERVVRLPLRAGRLSILLENQGRVGYGPRIGEPKGLVGPARTATRILTDWKTSPIRLDPLGGDVERRLADGLKTDPSAPVRGPVFVRGEFDAPEGSDLLWSIGGWGKGYCWVNGVLLGRYWSWGPTRTLYVPGPIVRQRGNTVVVLEPRRRRQPGSAIRG